MNPDLSRADFDASVNIIAEQEGIPTSAVVDAMYSDSAAARANQAAANTSGDISTPKSGGIDTGSSKDFTWVKASCASPGYFTYSYARNNYVAHGRNALFTENCKGVHMPGGDEKYIREFFQTSQFRHHASYPAHIRRVNGASAGAHARAAAFGKTNLTEVSIDGRQPVHGGMSDDGQAGIPGCCRAHPPRRLHSIHRSRTERANIGQTWRLRRLVGRHGHRRRPQAVQRRVVSS